MWARVREAGRSLKVSDGFWALPPRWRPRPSREGGGVIGTSNRGGVKQRVGVKGRPTGSTLRLRWATHRHVTHKYFPGGLCSDSHRLAVEADVCDCRSLRLGTSKKKKKKDSADSEK